jgi:hypothetical protein
VWTCAKSKWQHSTWSTMVLILEPDPYKILFTLVFKNWQPMFLTIEWRKWPRNTEITNYLKCVKWVVTRCAIIMRIAQFVNRIFQIDPSEMMLAFQYMMKAKSLCQHFERIRWKISTAFEQFSDSAQRIVYTAADYGYHAEINWQMGNWQDFWFDRWAEKARDYLMKLPGRMAKYLKD